MQIAALLALVGPVSIVDLEEGIWPGRVLGEKTRSTATTKARRWFGTNPEGELYLPHASTEYGFNGQVSTDWDQWCEMVGDSPENASTATLEQAVELVRGRPFNGVRAGTYSWADLLMQEMICSIVDVFYVLADRALRQGDVRAAVSAALRGLAIEPASELLWRARLKAHARLGDRRGVQECIYRLRQQADDLFGELEDETVELIDQLESLTAAAG